MNQRPAEEIGRPNGVGDISYLVVFAVASTLLVSTWLGGLRGHDHFVSYPLNVDAAFYRGFSGRKVPEI